MGGISAKRVWKPEHPHFYSLETKPISRHLSTFHLILQSLSDDPEIRAKQTGHRGIFRESVNQWASTIPKTFLHDMWGRPIMAGDMVYVTSKFDRVPLKVIAYEGTKFLILEDVTRGGRVRVAIKFCIVVTDQLKANLRRKQQTQNQQASFVNFDGKQPRLKVVL